MLFATSWDHGEKQFTTTLGKTGMMSTKLANYLAKYESEFHPDPKAAMKNLLFHKRAGALIVNIWGGFQFLGRLVIQTSKLTVICHFNRIDNPLK